MNQDILPADAWVDMPFENDCFIEVVFESIPKARFQLDSFNEYTKNLVGNEMQLDSFWLKHII